MCQVIRRYLFPVCPLLCLLVLNLSLTNGLGAGSVESNSIHLDSMDGELSRLSDCLDSCDASPKPKPKSGLLATAPNDRTHLAKCWDECFVAYSPETLLLWLKKSHTVVTSE